MELRGASDVTPNARPAEPLAEYGSDGQSALQIGAEIMPLVADFQREDVDLKIVSDTGDYVLVKDYFASFPPPDLLTSGGAKLAHETVSLLAGPGPVAQSGNTASDASNAIGEITALKGIVTVRHADGTKDELVEGFAVFQGDVLETGSDGSFSITFVDDTNFTMGSNGRAVLDELIFNPDSSSSNGMGISLLQGAFSLVSGQIAKDDPDSVSIKTPVGTIGIRGTSWSGKILQQGEQSAFTLFSGAIVVANEGGSTLLTVANQTVLVTSNFIAPSPPQVLTEGQLIDLYGGVLNLINPDWFKDEDDEFDPSKINPEAGPRGQSGSGGGAGFSEFAGVEGGDTLALSGILGLSELLDETSLDLEDSAVGGDDPIVENPVAAVQVVPKIDPETSIVNGFTIEVTLDVPSDVPVQVFYEIIPITASDGSSGAPDFVDEGGGVITVLPGETASGFSLTLVDDDVIEDPETLLIRLTGAENAVINPGASSALVVILDDDIGIVSLLPAENDSSDAVSEFSFLRASASVLDGETPVVVTEDQGFAVFKLVLDKALAPGVEVRVDYTVSGEGADRTGLEPGAIQTAVFSGGENGLPPGAEILIEIPLLDNDVYNPDSSFTVTLVGGSANAVADETNGQITVVLEDDETPVVTGDAEEADLAEAAVTVVSEDQSLGLQGGSGTLESAIFNTDQPEFEALGLTSGGVPVTLSGLGTSTVTGMADGTVIFTVQLDDRGQYDVSLQAPLDHLDDEGRSIDSLSLVLDVAVIDKNGSAADVAITVNIEDDVPLASDDSVNVAITHLPSYNLLFVLDSSGSMGTNEPQGDGTSKSRMAILKEAVANLIQGYEEASTALNITIIDFDGDAQLAFSGANAAEAITFVENPGNLVAGGLTNYADALSDSENGARGILGDQLGDPSLEGFETITYFISDGQPVPSSDGVPVDENGNAWQQFVDDNAIEVISVGIGNSIDLDALDLVENEGDAATNILKAADLEAFLIGTIPTVQTGSVVSDSTSGDILGADGATATHLILHETDVAALQTYEAQGGQIADLAEGGFSITFEIPEDGTLLQVTTPGGSEFEIDKTGSYRLETPPGMQAGDTLAFDYRLTDGDGDTSEATLTFNFVSDEQPLAARAASDVEETLIGIEGEDVFVIDFEENGVTVIRAFDIAEDSIDLDRVFDKFGLTLEERDQGEAWDISDVGGVATLTLSDNNQQIVFSDIVNPDVSDLTEIASRVLVGDES